MDERNTLEMAVRFLAGRCDFAQSLDDIGYNAVDTHVGHRLAALPQDSWSPKDERAAWEILHKYTEQLATGGIDYAAIPVPPADASDRVIAAERSTFLVLFPFDLVVKDIVKHALPGVRFNGAVYPKRWELDANRQNAEAIQRLCASDGFVLRPSAAALIDKILNAPVEAPAAPNAPAKPTRRITLYNQRFMLFFPYGDACMDYVRAITGRKFAKEPAAHWHTPINADACQAMAGLIEQYEFVATPEAQAAIQATLGHASENLATSNAAEAELEVAGMATDQTLRPFQKAGIMYASRNLTTFIADDPGLGKTCQALATCQHLDAFPLLVICPASLKYNWRNEAHKWLPQRRVAIIDGRSSSIPKDAEIVIVNYDVLGDKWEQAKNPKTGRTAKRVALTATGESLLAFPFQAIAMDESQAIKAHASLRSGACKRLADGKRVRLCLTGTPIENAKPIELLPQLDALGRLDDFGGFWNFTKRFCDAHQESIGRKTIWNMTGHSNEAELASKLRATCYIRRMKRDVAKEIPEISFYPVAMPMSEAGAREYARAEDDLEGWVVQEALADEDFLAAIANLDDLAKERAMSERAGSAAQATRRAEQLVRIGALRQLAARGKLDAALEWIENFIAGGDKIVVFAWHREFIDAVAERFGAPKISGEVTGKDRDAAVTKFQNDPDCKVIACNIRAGGVGLTLTAASNVAFIELPWTSTAFDQCYSRCHRIGATLPVGAWVLSADGTIDDDMWALIEAKRITVEAVTNGLPTGDDTHLLAELLQRLAKRQTAKAGKKA